jgi:plasmid stabilization system protein ParE
MSDDGSADASESAGTTPDTASEARHEDVPIDVLPEAPDELRAAILDQLTYLEHEIEALKDIVGVVPETLQSGRPTPDERTMKEVYGLMAALDEAVHPKRIKRIAAEDEPTLDPIDPARWVEAEDWNAQPMQDLLDRVQDARRALVETLRALPPEDWARTATVDGETRSVYEIAYQITQDDARRLRMLSQRMHDANLGDSDEDLPK